MSAYRPQPHPSRRARLRRLRIDGQAFKRLVEAGLTWLRTHQEVVNQLNVYPIPDGDTGTNMVLTLEDAYNAIAHLPETHFARVAQALAQGALLGARGNSGVIFSQILRGFARGVGDTPVLLPEAFVRGLQQAKETAYRGVVRPVEGTILTVIRMVAEAVENVHRAGNTDLIELLETAVIAAHDAVERTPEMLDVLREAGVVDAGGKGFFFFLEGMLRWIDGLPLDQPSVEVLPLAHLDVSQQEELIEPGQDFEVVVDFRPGPDFHLESFYQRLQEMGTAIQVGEGEGMYRMHIHVPLDRRYEPIDYIMRIGTVLKVHMENLQVQVQDQARQQQEEEAFPHLALENVEAGRPAVVAVAPGPGIARVFLNLGAAAIVKGGQTMNPSVQDFLHAMDLLPTDQILLLPNNKNVILAAREVREFTVRDVRIIPTRTVAQGLAAMVAFDATLPLDTLEQRMTAAMQDVRSGAVTQATRTAQVEGVDVREGQYIALLDEQLVLAADTLEDALLGLVQRLPPEAHEILTLFYGDEVDANTAHRLADKLRQAFPHLEIEVHAGGQPHYAFILAAE